MSVDYDVPQWLTDYIRTWIDRFDLEVWDIKVRLEMVVNNNPECMARCDRQAAYNSAKLTFRADIEDSPYWRKIVLHECLHIVLARADAYVFEIIIPELDAGAEVIAHNGYNHLIESAVSNLTDAFWRQVKDSDAPEAAHADA